MAELTVMGIGNILMSDEGVGVRLMEAVRDGRAWPGQIEFIDGGAGGLNLLNFIEEARRMVVFDAAEMDLPPGECRVIGPDQVAPEDAEHYVSMHDVPFMETLKLCEQFSHTPDLIRIMVTQPASIEFSRSLSPELTAAFGSLVEAATKLVLDTARLAGIDA
jgi:hydrogenase maturation protease